MELYLTLAELYKIVYVYRERGIISCTFCYIFYLLIYLNITSLLHITRHTGHHSFTMYNSIVFFVHSQGYEPITTIHFVSFLLP